MLLRVGDKYLLICILLVFFHIWEVVALYPGLQHLKYTKDSQRSAPMVGWVNAFVDLACL